MSIAFRKILVCLLAVFAVSAVAASTASAHRVWTVKGATLPTCVEVAGEGKEPPKKFDNSECNTQVKELKLRKWQFDPKSFTVTKSGSFVLTAGTEKITCTEEVVEGGEIENVLVETKGPTGRDKGTTKFKKCTASKAGCTVTEPIVVKGTTGLAETTGTTVKIVDVFFPQKENSKKEIVSFELTPAEVTAFGTKAKEEQEKLLPYTKIEQTGTGCVAATTVEGDGVAGEFLVEGEATSHVLNFPATAITPVKLWNGLTIALKLKAFGVAAKEVGSLTIALTTGEAFGVQ